VADAASPSPARSAEPKTPRPRADAALARLRREGEGLAAPFPPLVAEAERVAATVHLGVHGRRRPGVGESFWEYRRYRHEDAASRIDWRRSARGEHLFVKENEWEAANTVWLWRDGREGMTVAPERNRPTKKERASVLLIALASLLARGGERIAVMGESAAPRAGRLGFSRVSMRLADGAGALASVDPAAVSKRSRIVLASDFYEPLETWRARLASFAGAGVRGVLAHVTDPEEEDFPFRGRSLFRPPGGGAVGGLTERLFGRAETIRASYRARFAAHRAGLMDLARHAGWGFVATRTDRPAAEALLTLWTRIAPPVRR
jgi:uncharacterized protein (DUF58 family)